MTGRHQSYTSTASLGRSRVVIGGALVAVLLLGAVTAIMLSRHPRHATPTAAPTSCTSGLSLSVIAAPGIAQVLSDVAAHWTAEHPVIDAACPTVTVRAGKSSTVEASLAKAGAAVPDIWVPDSSLWIQQLRKDISGVDSPAQGLWVSAAIATSPLVMVTSSAHAKALTARTSKGWASTLSGQAGVSMLDPTNSTDGLLALLTAQESLGGSATGPSRQLIGSLVGLSQSVLPDTATGFARLSTQRGSALAFPASEQQVVAANQSAAAAGPQPVAVYPAGKSLCLDFPVAQFSPPAGNPAQRDSALEFIRQLSQSYAHQRLQQSGLRGPAGSSLTPGPATQGVTAQPVTLTATPAPDRVSDGLRAWRGASRTNSTLVVIDLSGSMAETANGHQSKIQFAAEAERAAIDFFPDTSSLGLWGFSVGLTPTTDWVQLVPLGPLGDRVGNTTRRAALAHAAASLPARTGRDTGLYNAALAAYEAVRAGYDPAAVNSVVLLTDGSNTDTSGIKLAGLLQRLRNERNPSRPLPIITIAIGSNADVGTLKQISAASGGTTHAVISPDDIRGVLLDAIIRTS